MRGFIVDSTYKVIEDKAYVYLFGKLDNGETFLTINEYKPYFYIKKADLKKALKSKKKIEYKDESFKNFDGEDVVKIILKSPSEVKPLRDYFERKKIEHYEADVKFVNRFLIDHDINISMEIIGKGKNEGKIENVFIEPKLKPIKFKPNLKLLSLDIETDSKAKKIYSVSFYSKNYRKTLIVTNKKFPNTISCKDEKDLLYKFIEELLTLDPDIITGWNVIDFDLDFLKKKFDQNKIPFVLGRDNSKSKVIIQKSFFKESYAKISGRQVLDALHLLRISFVKLNDYKLDTAAQHFLGEKKLINSVGIEKGRTIDELYKKDQKKLIEYNLKDSQLVYDILEKSGVLDLTVERSLLTGMPLKSVQASIASLDSLYLKETRKKKIVCPSGEYTRSAENKILGGFVMEPKSGIYDYLITLDFKSLYPSIVRTFNIDPYTFTTKKGKNLINLSNGVSFRREEGLLAGIITNLWKARDEARKKSNELERHAIKILMNSFYGVLGSQNCRFFNPKLANSITYLARNLIKMTAEKIRKKGYEVIYMDTDSVFVDTKSKSYDEAKNIGNKIEKEINDFYSSYIKKEFNRDSFLELEFEKLFIRFLMPKLRGSEKGAKKRYAGLLKKGNKEEINIVGLEVVRRDWTDASKEFQYQLLDKIFHKKEIFDFIVSFVNNLKKGKYDNLLIYKKRIRKPLSEYVKTTPPHVKAAKKLKELKSNLIEYYITTAGPEPIQELKHKIDYDHYIDKQIKPVADSILVFFNRKFDEIIEGKQKRLFDY